MLLYHLATVVTNALRGLDLKDDSAGRVKELSESVAANNIATHDGLRQCRIEPIFSYLIIMEYALAFVRHGLVASHL